MTQIPAGALRPQTPNFRGQKCHLTPSSGISCLGSICPDIPCFWKAPAGHSKALLPTSSAQQKGAHFPEGRCSALLEKQGPPAHLAFKPLSPGRRHHELRTLLPRAWSSARGLTTSQTLLPEPKSSAESPVDSNRLFILPQISTHGMGRTSRKMCEIGSAKKAKISSPLPK